MKIMIFRVAEADQAWYVWPCVSLRLYCFPSKLEAEEFAREWAIDQGGTPLYMDLPIQEVAAFI